MFILTIIIAFIPYTIQQNILSIKNTIWNLYTQVEDRRHWANNIGSFQHKYLVIKDKSYPASNLEYTFSRF